MKEIDTIKNELNNESKSVKKDSIKSNEKEKVIKNINKPNSEEIKKNLLKNSLEYEYEKDSKNNKYEESLPVNSNIVASQPNEKTPEEKDEEEFKNKGPWGLLKEGQILKAVSGTRKYGTIWQRLAVGTAVGAAAGAAVGAAGAVVGVSALGMASSVGGAFTDIGFKSIMAGSILGNCFCIKSGSNKEKKTEQKEVDNGPTKMTIEDYYKELSTKDYTINKNPPDVTIIDGSSNDVMTIPGSAVVVYRSDNIEINLNKIKFDEENCKNSIYYNKLYNLQKNINNKGGSLQTKLMKKDNDNDICFNIDIDNIKAHDTEIKNFMSPIIKEDYEKKNQQGKDILENIYHQQSNNDIINNNYEKKNEQNNSQNEIIDINNNSDKEKKKQNDRLLQESINIIANGQKEHQINNKKKKIVLEEFFKNEALKNLSNIYIHKNNVTYDTGQSIVPQEVENLTLEKQEKLIEKPINNIPYRFTKIRKRIIEKHEESEHQKDKESEHPSKHPDNKFEQIQNNIDQNNPDPEKLPFGMKSIILPYTEIEVTEETVKTEEKKDKIGLSFVDKEDNSKVICCCTEGYLPFASVDNPYESKFGNFQIFYKNKDDKEHFVRYIDKYGNPNNKCFIKCSEAQKKLIEEKLKNIKECDIKQLFDNDNDFTQKFIKCNNTDKKIYVLIKGKDNEKNKGNNYKLVEPHEIFGTNSAKQRQQSVNLFIKPKYFYNKEQNNNMTRIDCPGYTKKLDKHKILEQYIEEKNAPMIIEDIIKIAVKQKKAGKEYIKLGNYIEAMRDANEQKMEDFKEKHKPKEKNLNKNEKNVKMFSSINFNNNNIKKINNTSTTSLLLNNNKKNIISDNQNKTKKNIEIKKGIKNINLFNTTYTNHGNLKNIGYNEIKIFDKNQNTLNLNNSKEVKEKEKK